LGVNTYETDDGAVISRQERDYLTYAEGSDPRTARFPVETIVRTINGTERFGLAISLRGNCKWSDGAFLSAADLTRIKSQITALLDRLDAVYRIES
jgi:hypothetical protein